MTRSRRRKLARQSAHKRHLVLRKGVPVAATLLAAIPAAYADQPADTTASGGLQEVVVTAEKRVENLQNVPISVQVMDGKMLQQLDIQDLDEYVKFAPSVSYQRSVGSSEGGNAEPGSSHTFIRGVVSGGDGNHSGSQPTVGTYLDEIPVTTIDGTVDMHLYDMQRIEVLEGPQGTLFGASSESGTIRLITNKPDASRFSAGYDVTGNFILGHGNGYELQGFVNIPLASWAAVRLVGWIEQDPGYISNVQGTNAGACIVNGVRTFPSWAGQQAGSWSGSTGQGTVAPCPTPTTIGAGSINNAEWARDNYNTAIYRGGRGALKLDVGDHWTVTPGVMAQNLTTEGFFGYDPVVGNLDLSHFGPESTEDSWYLTSLTLEGKYSDWDIVDAAGFFKRTSHTVADYSDYSVFYDRAYGSGAYWVGNAPKGQPPGSGSPIMPQEFVIGGGDFEKWSNEFRVSTPADKPVRATFGLFIQRQLHNIWQQYTMPGYGYTTIYGGNGAGASPNPAGFADYYSIPNFGNTIWLTDQQRVDRDKAAFVQADWDISSQWTLTGGYRYYKYDNSLQGFFGYAATYSSHTGQSQCFPGAEGLPSTKYAPCTNLNTTVSDTGHVPKVTLTYKPTNDVLLYATYSEGFRPGGVNRVAGPQGVPYQADFLKNYELGWKSTWFNHRLRWNGAIFKENWDNFQFSFLVPPSITAIANGGNATIKGIQNELQWATTDHLMLTANFAFLNPYLTQNYCGQIGVTNCPNLQTFYAFNFPGATKVPGGEYSWVGPLAPAGTNLPVAPKFKGSLIARYTGGPIIDDFVPFAQAAFVYQTQTSTNLIVPDSNVVGMQPAYGLLDLSTGADNGKFSVTLTLINATNKLAQLSRFNETNPIANNQIYIAPAQPRTISLNFAQRF